jgi:hypothetical protein
MAALKAKTYSHHKLGGRCFLASASGRYLMAKLDQAATISLDAQVFAASFASAAN